MKERKVGEKMMFLVVWLRMEKNKRFWWGSHVFFSPPPKHDLP